MVNANELRQIEIVQFHYVFNLYKRNIYEYIYMYKILLVFLAEIISIL